MTVNGSPAVPLGATTWLLPASNSKLVAGPATAVAVKVTGDPSAPLLAALPPPALAALTGAHWPGNLDQLANVVANLALVRAEVTPDHVKRLLGESAQAPQAVAPEITSRFFELPLREAREAFERIYFEQLLGREQSNMSRVAEKAGLERTHLYRKLKQLNIRFSRRTEESGP